MDYRKLLGLALMIGAAATSASAQTFSNFGTFDAFPGYSRGRNVSVLERDRPEYRAAGLRSGGFLVYPRVDVSVAHTNNVYATDTNKISDTYTDVTPQVSLASDWSRHSLSGGAGFKGRRFMDEKSENQNGWFANGLGRLDVIGDSSIQGGFDVKKEYVDRSDSGSPVNAAKPVPVVTGGAMLRGISQAGRRRIIVQGNYVKQNFDDVASRLGGTIDQDNRDLTGWRAVGRGEYAVSPSAAVFGQVNYNTYDYRTVPGVVSRDSKEFNLIGGANFDLTALARGEVSVGYVKRKYEAATFNDIKGLTTSANIEYFLTPLTTITGTLGRGVQDSTVAGSGGYVASSATLRVDHELLRNLLLNANVRFQKDDYKGIDRNDKIRNFNLGARYLMNRGVGVAANVDFGKRDSNGAASVASQNYDYTRFMLTLVFQR